METFNRDKRLIKHLSHRIFFNFKESSVNIFPFNIIIRFEIMLFFMMRIGAIPLKFIESSYKIDVNLLVSRHENLYSRKARRVYRWKNICRSVWKSLHRDVNVNMIATLSRARACDA